MHLLRNKPAGRFSPVCLFRPDSIAVIGAGSEVGAQVMANLRAGGFKGGMLHADTAEGIEALPVSRRPRRHRHAAIAATSCGRWRPKAHSRPWFVCDADGLTDPSFAAESVCWGRARSASPCPPSG